MSIFIEAIVVGLICCIIGYVFHMLSLKIYGDHDLNNIQMFMIHIFSIGLLTHLICEYSGLNKWYCTNGTACKQ